ncbi:hypothetical protein N8I77_007206 [Diaporthe amygdali]|uniref:Ketoreductase domain-containing protein n=1 Tax=Phomopsis amygdali TaxID=1214568 RepID=A0AAD9SBJ9_PHOAM|nr:hypothetical protein N8I77_007206 [Diaporthe amygdali]
MTPSVLDTLSLAGKVAIITGSGRNNGIGAGIARALARNGAAVAINFVSDESASRAEETAQKIRDLGARVAVVRGSIETQDGAKNIVAESLKALDVDHVDILVNNAGVGASSPLLDVTPEQLQKEFGVNVFGALYMTQAAIKLGNMPRGGRIINIGSIVSRMGPADMGVYATTKAATDALMATWALELGRSRGITINTVAPGPVDTDIGNDIDNPDVTDDSFFVDMTRAEARTGTVDDIADAVLLLVSGLSRWITAQFISVSGGINIL